jgi:hypothetical protein
MIVRLATAPPFPFDLVSPPIAIMVFLFVVMVLHARDAVVRFDKGLRTGGWISTVSAFVVLGLNIALAIFDLSPVVDAVSPLGLNIVFSILLGVIILTLAFRGLVTVADNRLGQDRRHMPWAISWFGLAVIGVAAWIWDGFFRFGPEVDGSGTAILWFWLFLALGLQFVVIGWIVVFVTTVQRRRRVQRANAALRRSLED